MRAAIVPRQTPWRAEIESSGGKALVPYRRRSRCPPRGCRRMADMAVEHSAASISSSTMRRCGRKTFCRDELRRMARSLDVTLDGAFHCIKACLPVLRKSGAGTIVIISGAGARIPARRTVPIGDGEAGIVGFTRAASYDLASDGITVNCVVPRADRHAASERQTGTRATFDPSDHHRRARQTGRCRRRSTVPVRPGCALHQRQAIHANGGAYHGT